jgi:hypothetical protein
VLILLLIDVKGVSIDVKGDDDGAVGDDDDAAAAGFEPRFALIFS